MKKIYLSPFCAALTMCALYSNAQVGVTKFGTNALAKNTGIYNSAFGYYAMSENTTGSRNTAHGYRALGLNTTGSYNTAIGKQSLYSNTSGNENTATGNQSLYSNTIGFNNTANGSSSLAGNTTGSNNSALGYQALYLNQTGSNNTATGYQALYNDIAGANTANGFLALYANTTGFFNTASGVYSLVSNVDGSGNTASGYNSLNANQSGTFNTATGYRSLNANTSGNYNTANGDASMYANTTGSYNTAVGFFSLRTNTTGSYNTAIGDSADVKTAGLTNATAIGYKAIATGSNKIRVGNNQVTSIGGHVGWTTFSDGRYKQNIKENIPGLEFIKSLRPITYTVDVKRLNEHFNIEKDLDADSRKAEDEASKIIYTGFVAQEVENAAKKLNYDFSGVDKPKSNDDLYGIRYADFVVPLVKAVQELSKKNDSKDSLINDLQKQINELKSVAVQGNQTQNIKTVDLSTASLEQNAPNPFNSSTVIRYHIPASVSNAQIMITNANGNMIKTFTLNNKGAGSVTINAGELAAGSYYYTLITDGKKADSKQMILNK